MRSWEEGFASNGPIAQIVAMIDHIVLIDGLDDWEVDKDFLNDSEGIPFADILCSLQEMYQYRTS